MSQIRRAAVSVPSNIAEGWGRSRTGDYIRLLGENQLRGRLEIETGAGTTFKVHFTPPAH